MIYVEVFPSDLVRLVDDPGAIGLIDICNVTRYTQIVIASFRDRETKAIFEGTSSKKARRKLPTQLWKKARAKLDEIDAATELGHLATPSNKLHPLSGNREGQHAIWINDQYRICFVWIDEESAARNVEITDYH